MKCVLPNGTCFYGRWCLQRLVALYTIPSLIYGIGSPKRASRPAVVVGYDVISSSGMRTDKFAFVVILTSLSVTKLHGETWSCFKGRWCGWWLIPGLFNGVYLATQVQIKWKDAEMVCFKWPSYSLYERTEENQESLSEWLPPSLNGNRRYALRFSTEWEIRSLYINKIQQYATVCRYLFTTKLIYMFRVSIAPIIRST
jgi:hypothetical protein